MEYHFLEENSQFLKDCIAISESEFYKGITPELGYQHKLGHIQKVMLFSQIIGQKEDLDERQMNILLASAAFHDSGRIKDRDNGEHGALSAQVAKNYFKNNKSNPYGITQSDVNIVQVVIAYHVIEEKEPGKIDIDKLKEMCNKYSVDKDDDFEKIVKISAILKDADALDRARFSSKISSKNSLDSNLLRTETAKNSFIIELAMEINQYYAEYVLQENYQGEPIEQGDNSKTLQLLRYKYKVNNGGIRKIEKEVPLSIVLKLFREVLNPKRIKEDDGR